ncbi:MAG: NlpC/P60 family protein [Fidelibacterota bacterium]
MENKFFTVNISVANVYRDPDYNSPVVTQALLGESCACLELQDQWIRIRQWDEYEGWIHSLSGVSSNETYATDCTFDQLWGALFLNPGLTRHHRDLSFGAVVKGERLNGRWYITLPDGTHGWARVKFRRTIREPLRTNVIKLARYFLGSPYCWGGKTPRGFDCSGLVQTVFKAVGVSLPRDARDQSEFFTEARISFNAIQAGDLHFFGRDGIVTHVGIATGPGTLIHSRGWVQEESLEEDQPNFNPHLKAIYMHSVTVEAFVNS